MNMKSKLLAILLCLVLCVSLVPAVAAAPATNVTDAKDDIATVVITQTCNWYKGDYRTHNYATSSTEVDITYEATLQMTEEMATYLWYRQGQLMDAKFNIHVDMDMDLLEFDTDADTLTITFTSTFLKPWKVDESYQVKYPDAFLNYKAGNYSSAFKGYDASTKMYTYEISVSKAWAETQDTFDIPMELIVYFDGTTQPYGYDEVKDHFSDAELKGKPLMYKGFTVDDWMAPIKATLAEMRVQDWVEPTVTTNPATWKTIEASGTVDGQFSYIGESAANSIGILRDYEKAGYVTTLEFGNPENDDPDDDIAIEEWTSNVVTARLVRWNGGPDSPYLNLEDHFAYVIGYPDGLVHPEGKITRAEVATIFFRMLTDEVRNAYWCQTNPYNDVSLNDWYNNAISTLTNMGAIEGYPDGGFHPNANITRAEFATMAVRFFLVTEDYTWTRDAFSDIGNHWANKYINLAYLLELVNGYPDGTFRPQNDITRAEAMTIVNNTLRRDPCKEGLLPVEDMIMWPDNMDASTWYYEEVQEATNSHDYTYVTEFEGELWTAELPVRDWAAFEKAWSDANSAYNPGEVVDGR